MQLKPISLLWMSIAAALAMPAHANWSFRGTPNAWGETAMTAGSGSLFTTCQTFASSDNNGVDGPRFKVVKAGGWAESYPTADQKVPEMGTYNIEFDSTSKAIKVTKVTACAGANIAPVAVISSDSLRAVKGQPLLLSASDSSDEDGEIASYAWSNGETGEDASFTFDVAGEQEVTLTVTDDKGATHSVKLTISVFDPKLWYVTTDGQKYSAMTAASEGFCSEQSIGKNGAQLSFLSGDLSTRFPSSGNISSCSLLAGANYNICYTPGSNKVRLALIPERDTQAPTASTTPAAGRYPTAQSIKLVVSDDKDSAPTLYYTIDGSTPTTKSPKYTGQSINASDVTSEGADLVIKTLAVDAAGNQQQQSFNFTIGELAASGDFREETIYFLMTARFYDGDPSNNYYNRDRYKEGDPTWRGDFKGLIQKLDYIKDLGFTAIWITPPVENRSGLDYHGYHGYDFYKIDPRLESPDATYQDLIDAAHAKGIKIVQDVVVNHSGQYGLRGKVWIDHMPIKYYVPKGSSQGLIDNGPYKGNLGDYKSPTRCDDDNPVAPEWYRNACNSDPEGTNPIVDPKTGTTLPLAGYDPGRFFGIDAQGLDPNWYHLDGFMAGGDWENPLALQRKHLAGDTIDLATGRQNVKDYINGAIKMYLDMGVDAIRVDTLKHVERNELLTYIHEWQAHKPGLFVFGENLVKGTGWGSEIDGDNASAVIRPWWYTRLTNDPSNPNGGGDSGLSVLDFSLFSTFRDNVTKGSFGGIGSIFSKDWIYGDATKLVTFFQNHDVGPDNDFKYRYGGEDANAALVYNLLWTARGIPTLYYGEEIAFKKGAPQDIDGEKMTVDQTGRAYFGAHLDDPATQQHPLYQHIKRLNQIRKAIPALQKAEMSNVSEWGGGISFIRDYSEGDSYAVVGLASGGAQSITVKGVRDGTYKDAVTGASKTASGGSLTFDVAGNSAGIWVLNGPGKIGVDGTWLK